MRDAERYRRYREKQKALRSEQEAAQQERFVFCGRQRRRARMRG